MLRGLSNSIEMCMSSKEWKKLWECLLAEFGATTPSVRL